MHVHFTAEQESQLIQLAAHEEIAAEELVKQAALRLLDADPLFIAGVRRGFAQADAGELIEHDQVMARIERLLQAR